MSTEPSSAGHTTARHVRTLARLARQLERSSGELTLPQYRILAMVADGSNRATELAGGLALAKPTVSTMVDGLVERGYLARGAVEGDRRAIRLAVTRAGHGALAQAERSMGERLDGLLARIDAADDVLRALTALEAALDAARDERLRRLSDDAARGEPAGAAEGRR